MLFLFEAMGVDWRGLFCGGGLAGTFTKAALPVKGGDLGVLLLILYFKVILNISLFLLTELRVSRILVKLPRNLIT